MAATGFDFVWALDAPKTAADHRPHWVFVRGWLGLARDAQIDGPDVVAGARFSLPRESRADVEALFPELQIVGFRAIVPVRAAMTGPWSLRVVIDGVERCEALPVTPSRKTTRAFEATKQTKLNQIEPHLRCPRRDGVGACGGRFAAAGATRTCERCGAQYRREVDGFNMLTDELLALAGIAETDNVSQNPYDEVALDLVRGGGLVLDAGAGLRPDYHDNVVYVDVVSYPTTDVRAVGERLPFADATFDAAISYAVLEHVRDPFACAAEIGRVVRPGGRIVIGAPFLFPYHGYPHHYYNMTMQGLTELFRPDFDIDRAWVPDSGLPIYMLTYVLDRWVASLPEPIAEQFRAMSVDELRGPAEHHLDQPYVRGLSDNVNAELAAAIHIVATKREPNSGSTRTG